MILRWVWARGHVHEGGGLVQRKDSGVAARWSRDEQVELNAIFQPENVFPPNMISIRYTIYLMTTLADFHIPSLSPLIEYVQNTSFHRARVP